MSEQSANISLDGLLSSRTVCGLLDTSDRNLRRLVASGEFPPPDRRLGRGLRWKHSTVQGFLDGNGNGQRKDRPPPETLRARRNTILDKVSIMRYHL